MAIGYGTAPFTRKIPKCVYHHSIDGVVFYVGCGNPMRPYATTLRNRIWIEIATARQDYKIDIVGWFDDEKSARAFERKEIERLLPEANDRCYPDYPLRSRRYCFCIHWDDYGFDRQYRAKLIRMGLMQPESVSK